MNKLISIIVPVYNGEKYLYECLESIRNQTLENIEVIIINDGSIDSSMEIARKFNNIDNRFRIIEGLNKGVSNARNLGIEYSNGEYIGFVDCDDIIEPNMFEVLYNIAEKYDEKVIVASGFDNIMNGNLKKEIYYEQNISKFNEDDAIIQLFSNNLVQGFVWNKLYRKSMINNIRFNDNIHAYEDLLFNFEIFTENNANLVLVNNKFYHYRLNDEGCMFSINFSNKKLTALDAYEIILENSNIKEKSYEYIKSYYVLVNIILISNILKSDDRKKDFYINQLIFNLKKYKKEFLKSNINIKYKIGYIIIKISPKLFNYINSKI